MEISPDIQVNRYMILYMRATAGRIFFSKIQKRMQLKSSAVRDEWEF